MTQENLPGADYTFVPFGYVRSKKQNFFSKLNSFALFVVINKDGRILFGIPMWPILVGLVAFFVIRAKRS